tara:strand:+ start:250 stop:1050 length:801 start_codon:yes stop_codon:yes gene_type:complete
VNKNISVIITLYKTPIVMLKRLHQYKKFPLFLFEQEGNVERKREIKKILNFDFNYYYSKKNLGLSKSSNFLLGKVNSRFLLFTQPDIIIDHKSIIDLIKIFEKDKNIIFVSPNISSKKKKPRIKKVSYVKKINAACMICDVKKLKKLGFFDENYFLYWEDIDLMRRVNKMNYKMITANKIYAKHSSSQSSENNLKTKFIRSSNFIYGELIYDLKYKKLRIVKIFRKIIQNMILFFFNIIRFDLKSIIINVSIIYGVIKFILFLLKK